MQERNEVKMDERPMSKWQWGITIFAIVACVGVNAVMALRSHQEASTARIEATQSDYTEQAGAMYSVIENGTLVFYRR